jgi:hypothetical protein
MSRQASVTAARCGAARRRGDRGGGFGGFEFNTGPVVDFGEGGKESFGGCGEREQKKLGRSSWGAQHEAQQPRIWGSGRSRVTLRFPLFLVAQYQHTLLVSEHTGGI